VGSSVHKRFFSHFGGFFLPPLGGFFLPPFRRIRGILFTPPRGFFLPPWMSYPQPLGSAFQGLEFALFSWIAYRRLLYSSGMGSSVPRYRQQGCSAERCDATSAYRHKFMCSHRLVCRDVPEGRTMETVCGDTMTIDGKRYAMEGHAS
jgi:hypothetical protein